MKKQLAFVWAAVFLATPVFAGEHAHGDAAKVQQALSGKAAEHHGKH